MSEPLTADRITAQAAELAGRYPDPRSAVMPALNWVQTQEGWLSPESMEAVAAGLGVSAAYVQSFASFYSMFRLQPVGRHVVSVCTTVSCMLAGSDDTLSAVCRHTGAPPFGTSRDGEWFVERIECIGACDLAPAVQVDNSFPERVAAAAVPDFLRRAAEGRLTTPSPGHYASRRSRGSGT
jgi:NADH:ubiquinone oxidoreductase subunit E